MILGACNNAAEKLPEEKVLEEVKDDQGAIRRKVTTGFIPGEDLYLNIEEFDSNGNIIREYGAKPYGAKYKTEYKYDNHSRLINKIEYDFGTEEFENYKGGDMELYSLKDTLADFDTKRIKFNYSKKSINK